MKPRPHQNAAPLLARIAREVPDTSGWEAQTRGRPECETLLNFARTNLTPKHRHDAAPGDILIFRVSGGEAARMTGVMGADNFFTYEIPGRDGLQTNYLGHFWRTRLAAVFAAPEGFLNPSRECPHLLERVHKKCVRFLGSDARQTRNLECGCDSKNRKHALAAE